MDKLKKYKSNRSMVSSNFRRPGENPESHFQTAPGQNCRIPEHLEGFNNRILEGHITGFDRNKEAAFVGFNVFGNGFKGMLHVSVAFNEPVESFEHTWLVVEAPIFVRLCGWNEIHRGFNLFGIGINLLTGELESLAATQPLAAAAGNGEKPPAVAGDGKKRPMDNLNELLGRKTSRTGETGTDAPAGTGADDTGSVGTVAGDGKSMGTEAAGDAGSVGAGAGDGKSVVAGAAGDAGSVGAGAGDGKSVVAGAAGDAGSVGAGAGDGKSVVAGAAGDAGSVGAVADDGKSMEAETGAGAAESARAGDGAGDAESGGAGAAGDAESVGAGADDAESVGAASFGSYGDDPIFFRFVEHYAEDLGAIEMAKAQWHDEAQDRDQLSTEEEEDQDDVGSVNSE